MEIGETLSGLPKEHEYAWRISNGLGRTIHRTHPTIPDACYCEKHGSYTKCIQNTRMIDLATVEEECPYCKSDDRRTQKWN